MTTLSGWAGLLWRWFTPRCFCGKRVTLRDSCGSEECEQAKAEWQAVSL
jgi:hypothetical protein